MRQFLSALEYIHARNIVHRDLKPENLLLASKKTNSDLIITDFGLATVLESPDQKLYSKCGSPGYVAPELLQEKGYNCQADVFSAGVIFYIILTGRSLFKGDNPEEILEKNTKCQYSFNDSQWKQISPAAKDLVTELLKENPEERITPSEALQHPWFSDENKDGQGIVANQLAEFNNQRKQMSNAKNPLVSCTPVMAGVRLKDLPPGTPFLQSDGHSIINKTPLMQRFVRPVSKAGASAQEKTLRQMNVMGLPIMNKMPNAEASESQPSAQAPNGQNLMQKPADRDESQVNETSQSIKQAAATPEIRKPINLNENSPMDKD